MEKIAKVDRSRPQIRVRKQAKEKFRTVISLASRINKGKRKIRVNQIETYRKVHNKIIEFSLTIFQSH